MFRFVLVCLCLGVLQGCASAPPLPSFPKKETPLLQNPVQEGGERLDPGVWGSLPVHYKIDLLPEANWVQVDVRIQSPGERLALSLPSSWAGVDRLDRDIHGLSISCAGQPLSLEGGEARVVVHSRGCPLVQVSYKVRPDARENLSLSREERLLARLSLREALLHGQVFLLVPEWEGRTDSRSALTVFAPPQWSVEGTWTRVKPPMQEREPSARKGNAWTFLAQDQGHLHDSTLLAGELRVYTSQLSDGRALRLVLRDALPLPDKTLLQAVERIVAVQRAYLPDPWSWPSGTRGLSVMIGGHAGVSLLEGTGRRGGVVLDLGSRNSPREVGELLAHEIFHTLNGHLLVHEPGQEFETLWFKEGLTVYVALKTLVKAQLAEEDWFWRRLEELIGAYRTNPLSQKISGRSLDALFWEDPAARRLPYDKGALLGFLVDLSVDRPGDSGVETLFQDLLRSHGARGIPYASRDLRQALPVREDFWRSYVAGTQGLPLGQAMRYLGLSLEKESVAAPYYGFTLGRDRWGEVVTAVEHGGPAWKEGLRLGDRLEGSGEVAWSQLGAPARLSVARPGGIVPLVIRPEEGRRTAYVIHGGRRGKIRRFWGKD